MSQDAVVSLGARPVPGIPQALPGGSGGAPPLAGSDAAYQLLPAPCHVTSCALRSSPSPQLSPGSLGDRLQELQREEGDFDAWMKRAPGAASVSSASQRLHRAELTAAVSRPGSRPPLGIGDPGAELRAGGDRDWRNEVIRDVVARELSGSGPASSSRPLSSGRPVSTGGRPTSTGHAASSGRSSRASRGWAGAAPPLTAGEREQVAQVANRVAATVAYREALCRVTGGAWSYERVEGHQERVWQFEEGAIRSVLRRTKGLAKRTSSLPARSAVQSFKQERQSLIPAPEVNPLHEYLPWRHLERGPPKPPARRKGAGSPDRASGSEGAGAPAPGGSGQEGGAIDAQGRRMELVGIGERLAHPEKAGTAAEWRTKEGGARGAEFPGFGGDLSDISLPQLRSFNGTVARAAKAHASKQVGGQYSYPNPNIFMKGAGSPVVYRRVLDLSRKVTEAIKWEKKTRKTLHA